MRKHILLAIIFVGTLAAHAGSASPLLSLHGDANFVLSQDDTTVLIQGGGQIVYRSTSSGLGFFHLFGQTDLMHVAGNEALFGDLTQLDTVFLLPFHGVEIETSAGSAFAIQDLYGNGSSIHPRWGLKLLLPSGYASPRWELQYSGDVLFKSDTTGKILEQEALLTFTLEPDIRRMYSISITGKEGNSNIQDREWSVRRLGFEARTAGLIGYFTAWDIAAGSTWTVRNEPSLSNVSASLLTEWKFSPIRQISVFSDAVLEYSHYYSAALNAFTIKTTVRADYTPDDRIYFSSGLGGYVGIADFYDSTVWNLNTSFGIEYVF
ncbi:hypothetical protein [Spirochaeta dissipatitropha]